MEKTTQPHDTLSDLIQSILGTVDAKHTLNQATTALSRSQSTNFQKQQAYFFSFKTTDKKELDKHRKTMLEAVSKAFDSAKQEINKTLHGINEQIRMSEQKPKNERNKEDYTAIDDLRIQATELGAQLLAYDSEMELTRKQSSQVKRGIELGLKQGFTKSQAESAVKAANTKAENDKADKARQAEPWAVQDEDSPAMQALKNQMFSLMATESEEKQAQIDALARQKAITETIKAMSLPELVEALHVIQVTIAERKKAEKEQLTQERKGAEENA